MSSTPPPSQDTISAALSLVAALSDARAVQSRLQELNAKIDELRQATISHDAAYKKLLDRQLAVENLERTKKDIEVREAGLQQTATRQANADAALQQRAVALEAGERQLASKRATFDEEKADHARKVAAVRSALA
jgi:hypothetical protein